MSAPSYPRPAASEKPTLAQIEVLAAAGIPGDLVELPGDRFYAWGPVTATAHACRRRRWIMRHPTLTSFLPKMAGNRDCPVWVLTDGGREALRRAGVTL